MFTIELTERIDATPSRERTREGYLKVKADITKAGVSFYKKSAMDDPRVRNDPNLPEQIGVFRPLAILEAAQTQDSVKLKPVTYGHPSGDAVHIDNYQRVACGHMGDVRLKRDGHLQAEMLIHDSDLIQKIEAGEMEVSIGTHKTQLKREDGTFDGRPYHFKINQPLDINHVAVVERGKGRSGSTVRILESTNGDEPMNETDKNDIIKGVGDAITKAMAGNTKAEGGFNEAQFTAALTESIGTLITKDREAAEAKAKAAKEESDKREQALKESNEAATDRADVLVNARSVMTQEAYDKVKDKPIEAIIREALGTTVKDTDKMSEAELRGAFKVAVEQRLTEGPRGGGSKSAPPKFVSGGSSLGIKSGLDYNKFSNMNKHRLATAQ